MAENGFYPVSLTRHKTRFWRRFTSMDFARHIQLCPLVTPEILPAAASFPILFQKTKGGFEPVALLSLEAEVQTPFVDEAGNWRAQYLPSGLRCYPFLAQPFAGDNPDKAQLFVDENSGLVTSDSRDEPFFDRNGALAPEVKKVLGFFQERETAARDIRHQCNWIKHLLVPISTHSGVRLPSQLFAIDITRFDALDFTKLGSQAAAILRLVHAHEVSLSHLQWLERAQRLARRPQPAQSDGLNRFLCAVAADLGSRTAKPEVAYAG